jgi:hypothetical protein
MKCWYGAVLTGMGDCRTAPVLVEEVTAADPEHYLANNAIEYPAFQCREYYKVVSGKPK